ncbi:PucR family transcriptional regulator [Leucobacter muris]|uniref:PucR family transcriptional regulator n=1 Tax=Leucobacter muris TaxID=1935379 RepID=A0ABX5QHU1_9MICO|nr:helix-turn-helix domain-containing protein [Leucobacter muris]QAB18664.1 PucR family transcriptional regulator [Leucobacter muris]
MESKISTSPADGALRLEALVSELGPHTATAVGADPAGRTVRAAEFHDALEELPDEPDTLLLAPSTTQAAAAEFEALAVLAARLGYAAIALKCRDADVDALAGISRRTGIPLIRVGERVSWRIFDALIAQLLGEHRYSEDTHRDQGAEPLFALANELAEFFGGSVAIEDLGRRIIAYSSVPGQVIDRLRTQGILTRKVPDSPFNDDQYRTVLRSTEPIKYPRLDDEEPRVAFAIHAGTLPLGTVWAIDASGAPELTAEQEERMRTAAALAASHMLDDLRVRRATQQPREDRFRTLLDGDDAGGSEFAELGISEEHGAELLVFFPEQREHSPLPAQLRSLLQRHLVLQRPEAVTAVRGGRVYALVEHAGSRSPRDLVEPVLPVIDRLLGPGVRVALPGVASRPGEIAPLRDLATRLFDVAPAAPADAPDARLLTVEALRPALVFERAAALFAEASELGSPAIGLLRETDPLVADTLIAWCGAFGNVARTARELGIHENTVRYRLKRAHEHHGVDLYDPDTLLAAWLQLRCGVGAV